MAARNQSRNIQSKIDSLEEKKKDLIENTLNELNWLEKQKKLD